MPILLSEVPRKLEVDIIRLHKMAFIYNAVNDGWKVSMKDNKYIFLKQHEGKKEVYLDSYLEKFVSNNVDISKLI
jgi:hypothetical protein